MQSPGCSELDVGIPAPTELCHKVPLPVIFPLASIATVPVGVTSATELVASE